MAPEQKSGAWIPIRAGIEVPLTQALRCSQNSAGVSSSLGQPGRVPTAVGAVVIPQPADKAVRLGEGNWRPRGSAGLGWGGGGSGGTQSWPGERETCEGPGAGRANALRPAGGRVELLRRAMDRPLERESSQRMRTFNRWAS